MISIIIPTLNEEKYIKRTIKAFSNMKMSHEIIISDGGSNDKTVDIARSLGAQVFVHDNSYRSTIADGRNIGARAAKGNILMFLDADCIIFDPDFFAAKVENYFKDHNETVAICPVLRVLPEYLRGADRLVTSFMNFSFILFTNVLHIPSAPGECQIMLKKTFDEVNGYNKNLIVCEDIDMFNRLSKKGKVTFITSLKVWHTCRRAHKVGWPKLLFTWFINSIYFTFKGRVYSKEWKPIR